MGSRHILLIASGLAVGILVSAFVPQTAEHSEAGTALRMDLGEVVDASGLVIEGRVIGGQSGETPEGSIYTDWHIAVNRTWWGEDENVRTVRLPGGALASGKAMIVPGMPSLAPGEDVVLLLSEESPSGLRVPTGLGQGKYRIIADGRGAKRAIRTGENMTLASTAGSLSGQDGLAILDYAELVAQLEAAAQAKRSEGAGAAPVHGER